MTCSSSELDLVDAIDVLDLRPEQPNPPPLVRGKKKWRVRRGRVVERDPATVTGIVVHQTAVRFGVSGRAVKRAGGDRRLALARRALGVACHAMAFHDAKGMAAFAVLANPLPWYVWHGNGFNHRTLGLEIDGNYPGRVGDGRTWNGKRPAEVTKGVVAAARRALRELVERGRAEGMPIVDVFAHRQSSKHRRGDPGQELWRRVVLEYAVPVLGLVPHQALVVGSGRPVPELWDPDGVGAY